MEDKIRKFLRRRFTPSGIFEARKSGLAAILLQCIFIGMILSFSLSMEMLQLDEKVLQQMFPACPKEAYALLTAALSLLMYPVTIILNILYTAIISGICMMLNYSASCRFTYKNFFAFFSFSVTIPALCASLVGAVVSVAFVYLVYNFGSVLFAWLVYSSRQNRYTKELLAGEQEKEKDILAKTAECSVD